MTRVTCATQTEEEDLDLMSSNGLIESESDCSNHQQLSVLSVCNEEEDVGKVTVTVQTEFDFEQYEEFLIWQNQNDGRLECEVKNLVEVHRVETERL